MRNKCLNAISLNTRGPARTLQQTLHGVRLRHPWAYPFLLPAALLAAALVVFLWYLLFKLGRAGEAMLA